MSLYKNSKIPLDNNSYNILTLKKHKINLVQFSKKKITQNNLLNFLKRKKNFNNLNTKIQQKILSYIPIADLYKFGFTINSIIRNIIINSRKFEFIKENFYEILLKINFNKNTLEKLIIKITEITEIFNDNSINNITNEISEYFLIKKYNKIQRFILSGNISINFNNTNTDLLEKISKNILLNNKNFKKLIIDYDKINKYNNNNNFTLNTITILIENLLPYYIKNSSIKKIQLKNFSTENELKNKVFNNILSNKSIEKIEIKNSIPTKTFSDFLSNNINIKTFSFSCTNPTNENPENENENENENYFHLLNSLAKNKTIKKLIIKNYNEFIQEDQFLIKKILQENKNLKIFKISGTNFLKNFPNTPPILDIPANKLILEEISKNKNLKKIKISKFSLDFFSIVKILEKNKNLKKFKLNKISILSYKDFFMQNFNKENFNSSNISHLNFEEISFEENFCDFFFLFEIFGQLKKLEIFSFNKNFLGRKISNIIALCDLIKKSKLKKLSLDNNFDKKFKEIENLFAEISQSEIKELSFNNNFVEIFYLKNLIRKNEIQILKLKGIGNIDHEFVKILKNNKSLIELDLSNNGLGCLNENEIKDFFFALRKSKIRKLFLEKNLFKDDDRIKNYIFFYLINNEFIEEIYLSQNFLVKDIDFLLMLTSRDVITNKVKKLWIRNENEKRTFEYVNDLYKILVKFPDIKFGYYLTNLYNVNNC